jgi:hypothetical protein
MELGGKCARCGSEFELQLHHVGGEHLSHEEKKRHPDYKERLEVLCATCHFLEDHEKMLHCCAKAELKRYYARKHF